MSERRRIYTKEFKQEAIQLAISQNGNVSAVARNLGISQNLLNRWVREYKACQEHSFSGNGELKVLYEESRQLRKELADTRLERDILKKALATFSKPSQ